MMSARRALLASLLALSLLGTGCGSARMLEKAAPMFVPPLPNRPRLQFLASFVGGKDIEEESQFQEFLTGRKEQQGALSKPYSAVMLDDGIAVADAGAGELFVFDFKDRVFRTLRGNSGGGRAKKPINLSADKEGNLYVTDVGRNQVLSYAKDETYLRAYGKEGDMKPGGVAVHGNEVYVCDLAHHQIVVFDRRRGTLLRRLGSPGKEPGQLYFPTNIATGPNGDLYISETGNFRFQQMRPDGTSVRVVGAIGKTPGSFSRPKGIAVSPEGLSLWASERRLTLRRGLSAFHHYSFKEGGGSPSIFLDKIPYVPYKSLGIPRNS